MCLGNGAGWKPCLANGARIKTRLESRMEKLTPVSCMLDCPGTGRRTKRRGCVPAPRARPGLPQNTQRGTR